MRYKLHSLLLLTVFATISHAAVINGKLNFAGDVRVTSNSIDFLPVGGPDGQGFITTTVTDYFDGLQGTNLRVRDIVAVPPGPVDPNTTGNDFLYNFAARPGLTFDINFLFPGNIPGTPFVLVDTPNGAAASFSVRGIFSDGVSSSGATGIFSTQFTGMSSAQVLGTLAANGFIENSFSATFIANAVPEPGTTSLLLGGLLAFGVGTLRRRR